MLTHSPQHCSRGDIICAKHIGLKYNDQTVLEDLCFNIQHGSYSCIVGPNGAGKTQLMRLMLNLVKETSGTVVRNFQLSEIGYVPQKIFIDPTFPFTVNEFLQTYVRPQGFWHKKELPAFYERFAIESLIDKQLGKLSGGQLQRVLLAAVLSTNPEIIFLDEFSAGIDPQGQADLYNYLHELHHKKDMTIIMISHDIDVTAQYADNVLCLNKEMVCVGHPKDVFTADTFQKMYGIPLTKLQRHHHHD